MSLLNAHPTVEVNKKIRAEDFNILPIYTTLGLAYNTEAFNGRAQHGL